MPSCTGWALRQPVAARRLDEGFTAEEVDQLEAAVREAGTTEPHWPAVYVAGRKP